MKRRILHCVFSGLGGHASVLFTLLDARTRNDFDHFVVFFGVESLCVDYAECCTRLSIPFAFVRKNGRLAIRSHREVLRVIDEFRPDLIFINGSSLVVPLLGLRFLLCRDWAVAVRETQANHLKTFFEWVGSYVTAKFADAVVYLSDAYKLEVASRLRFVPERSRVIPNGVNTEEFGARSNEVSERVRLTMVSRLIAIKDHSTLVEAVRILHYDRSYGTLLLRIAGEGPTRTQLESQVFAAGLAHIVVFTGLLDRSAIVSLLSDTDVYVHCTFGETMSNSVLQAMSAELPVVGSDVQGVNNMIQSGIDGILVPVGDAVALANVLEDLIRSPSTRARLGRAARLRILNEWSQEKMVLRYHVLLSELLELNGAA